MQRSGKKVASRRRSICSPIFLLFFLHTYNSIVLRCIQIGADPIQSNVRNFYRITLKSVPLLQPTILYYPLTPRQQNYSRQPTTPCYIFNPYLTELLVLFSSHCSPQVPWCLCTTLSSVISSPPPRLIISVPSHGHSPSLPPGTSLRL